MKMKVFLLVIFLIFIALGLYANELEDFKDSSLPITEQVNILLERAKNDPDMNLNSRLLFAEQARLLADSENYYEGQVNSLFLLSSLTQKERDLHKSSEYLTQAESIIFKHDLVSKKGKLFFSQAVVNIYQNEFEKAKELLLSALEYKRFFETKTILRLYNNLANIYYYQFNFSQALQFYLMQESLARKYEFDSEVANALTGIANIYNDYADYETSVKYYEEAIEIFTRLDKIISLYTVKNNLATIYSKIGEEKKARDIYQEILSQAFLFEDKESIFFIYNNLGMLDLLHTNDFQSALNYFLKAEKCAREENSKHDLALALMNIGSAYKELGKNQLALDYLHQAYDLASDIPAYKTVSDIIKLILKVKANALNDTTFESLVYEFSDLQSKIGSQSAIKVAKIHQEYDQINYEAEMKLLEIEKEKNELKIQHQKIILYISLTFLLILIVGVSFLIVTNRKLSNLRNSLQKQVDDNIKRIREQDSVLILQNHQAAMGEMISMIAHQWKQPLNAIGITIQNLEDAYQFDELDEKLIQDTSSKIMQLIQFMAGTIDSFRNYFKFGKEESFQIHEAIEHSLNYTAALLKRDNIAVSTDIDNDLSCYGQINLLVQVMIVLISNAKDAFIENDTQSPKLMIKAYPAPNNSSLISVTDNAGGINDNIIEHIFDAYFSTKNADKGTGIGLYIARNIIKQKFHGDITASNNQEGATFTLKLPLNYSDCP